VIIIVLNVHAPTEESDNTKDRFYELLEYTVNSTSTTQILLGDVQCKRSEKRYFGK